MKTHIIHLSYIRTSFSNFIHKYKHSRNQGFRAVARWGLGGALALPIFGRSANPILTRGDTLSPPSTTSPPGISDLATALGLRHFRPFSLLSLDLAKFLKLTNSRNFTDKKVFWEKLLKILRRLIIFLNMSSQ